MPWGGLGGVSRGWDCGVVSAAPQSRNQGLGPVERPRPPSRQAPGRPGAPRARRRRQCAARTSCTKALTAAFSEAACVSTDLSPCEVSTPKGPAHVAAPRRSRRGSAAPAAGAAAAASAPPSPAPCASSGSIVARRGARAGPAGAGGLHSGPGPPDTPAISRGGRGLGSLMAGWSGTLSRDSRGPAGARQATPWAGASGAARAPGGRAAGAAAAARGGGGATPPWPPLPRPAAPPPPISRRCGAQGLDRRRPPGDLPPTPPDPAPTNPLSRVPTGRATPALSPHPSAFNNRPTSPPPPAASTGVASAAGAPRSAGRAHPPPPPPGSSTHARPPPRTWVGDGPAYLHRARPATARPQAAAGHRARLLRRCADHRGAARPTPAAPLAPLAPRRHFQVKERRSWTQHTPANRSMPPHAAACPIPALPAARARGPAPGMPAPQ
jgi:hypothetical protein